MRLNTLTLDGVSRNTCTCTSQAKLMRKSKKNMVFSPLLSNWIQKYTQVQVDEDTVLTAQQVKAFRRRNAQL